MSRGVRSIMVTHARNITRVAEGSLLPLPLCICFCRRGGAREGTCGGRGTCIAGARFSCRGLSQFATAQSRVETKSLFESMFPSSDKARDQSAQQEVVPNDRPQGLMTRTCLVEVRQKPTLAGTWKAATSCRGCS